MGSGRGRGLSDRPRPVFYLLYILNFPELPPLGWEGDPWPQKSPPPPRGRGWGGRPRCRRGRPGGFDGRSVSSLPPPGPREGGCKAMREVPTGESQPNRRIKNLGCFKQQLLGCLRGRESSSPKALKGRPEGRGGAINLASNCFDLITVRCRSQLTLFFTEHQGGG